MIELRPFEPADFDRLIAWIATPELLLQWGGRAFVFPLDRAQLEAHCVRAARPGSGQRLHAAVLSAPGGAGEVVGHGELAEIDAHHRSAVLSRILVGPEALRGQHFGQAIVRALVAECFGTLGLHRASLRVFDFNTPAIRCYEGVGFRREGLLREARRFGDGDTWWNLVVMGLLRSEWTG